MRLPFRLSGSNWKAVSVAGEVGWVERSPSRKAPQKRKMKMRKNGGTRQSKDVSQHQRTSALYIGLLLLMLCVIPGRAVLFSIFTSSSLLFFTNSFLCFHPNLLPRSSCFVHHIAFLFLQFSLRLVSCQISSSRRNAQVLRPPIPPRALHLKKDVVPIPQHTEDR